MSDKKIQILFINPIVFIARHYYGTIVITISSGKKLVKQVYAYLNIVYPGIYYNKIMILL